MGHIGSRIGGITKRKKHIFFGPSTLFTLRDYAPFALKYSKLESAICLFKTVHSDIARDGNKKHWNIRVSLIVALQ